MRKGCLQAAQLWPAPREQGNLAQVLYCWQTASPHTHNFFAAALASKQWDLWQDNVSLNPHLNSRPGLFSSPNSPIVNTVNSTSRIQMLWSRSTGSRSLNALNKYMCQDPIHLLTWRQALPRYWPVLWMRATCKQHLWKTQLMRCRSFHMVFIL